MERAPLRPVPSRPAGDVDPQAAIRHVAAALPVLSEPEASALALVALAGRSRPEAAARLELPAPELAGLLARARKELRRSAVALPGSGWCERAERLVSDRLDDALEPPGPARLDVHLRNCPRCVEHERRLVQATDALVAGFDAARTAPEPPPPAASAPGPALAVVRRAAAPVAKPFGVPVRPAARRERPAAAPPAEREPVRRSAAALAWTALLFLAVFLAAIALGIAVAGLFGATL